MWAWILEIAVLLVFVGLGGFEGFIAWAVLTALFLFGRYFHHQTQLKAAEVLLRERQQGERQWAERQLAAKAVVAEREPDPPRRPRPQPRRAARVDGPAPAGIPCARCGAPNDADAAFCKECGASIVRARVCPCGQVNDRDAKFCKACGRGLTIKAAASQPAARAPVAPAEDIVVWDSCPYCHADVAPGASRCGSCWKALDPAAPKRAAAIKAKDPNAVTCPSCGEEVAPEATRCVSCWKEIPAVVPLKKCVGCGADNKGSARTCRKCNRFFERS